MQNSELNRKIATAALAIEKLNCEMHGVNDYGDVTGFCDQQSRIEIHLDQAVTNALTGSDALARRVRKFKEASY